MPTKAPASNFENAIAAYVAGESIETAMARFHVGYKTLRDMLRDRGILRDKTARYALATERASAANRRNTGIPDEEIVRRYLAGESENVLADAYGVSRGAIRSRLRIAGVAIRGVTEANRLMMAALSPEEIKRRMKRVHEAARGKKHSLALRSKIAKTRERNQTNVSPAELLLGEWLKQRGLDSTPQQAVGPYNLDLGAYPIAVEIFGGGWHQIRDTPEHFANRTRYLLDQGWSLIIVWVNGRKWPLRPQAADYVAAFHQLASSDPSLRGQYRVIWGDGKEVPPACLNLDNLTVIPSRRASNRARAADDHSSREAQDVTH